MKDFPRFAEAPVVSFDTEATGLNWPRDTLFGVSLALPDGTAVYHDIRETPGAIDWLNDNFAGYAGVVVCHNFSFDYRMAHRAGIYIPLERGDDTAIRACLINEHEHSYTLDHLCDKYLGDRKVNDIYADLAALFGGRATKGVQMKNLWRAPSSTIRPYAVKDAVLTLQLWQWQQEEIERQGIHKIVEFERRVMPPIIKAASRGIRVDIPAAEAAIAKLDVVVKEQQQRIDHLAGGPINVNSPKQARALFNPVKQPDGSWLTNGGYSIKSTDGGQPSLDAESLRSMEGDERAELILNIRSTIKTRDTFLGGHVLGHEVDGRVYPNINQTKGDADSGTGTGRLSYTDPAMQQIPSRNKKVAAIVKPVFLPDEGHQWLSLDAHSYEVRCFAHLVNDDTILEKYRQDELADFHAMVAEMTGLPRNATYSGQANSKQLNLSMIFNSGNGAIAQKMGMPWEWASFRDGDRVITYKKPGDAALEVIEEYHRRLPGVKRLANQAKAAAEAHGYVETRHGRRLRFPRKFRSYKASGLVIQATAADLAKEMWLITENLSEGDLVMSVHDSFELSVWEGTNGKALKDILQQQWRNSVPWFRVPLVLDLNGIGNNYWAASSGGL